MCEVSNMVKSEVEEATASSTQSYTVDTGMTLYDINKQIIEKLPELTDEDIEKRADDIRKFARTKHVNSNYFMLLGNELNYYTLFSRKHENINSPKIQDEVIECLKYLGTIKSIDVRPDDTAVECWIKNDDGIFMLLFFPYDEGVILCQ